MFKSFIIISFLFLLTTTELAMELEEAWNIDFKNFYKVCSSIPTLNGATATVSGQTPVTPINYNTQVDYTCSSEYSPSTVQSVYCGVVTAGQVDASSVACARSNEFLIKLCSYIIICNTKIQVFFR